MLKTALKPKWIAALVFALAVAAVFVLLSQWQFNRSLQTNVPPPSVTEKVAPLLDTLQPGQPLLSNAEGQLVTATGHYDASKQVIVESRMQDGKHGYWVVTALVVDGAPVLKGAGATKAAVIPVARGWIADPASAQAPPSGTVKVEGRLLNSEGPILAQNLPSGHVSALSSAELTNIWNTTTYAAFMVAHDQVVNGVDVGAVGTNTNMVAITVTATDQNGKVNWLNIFYSIEWVVFAGFAVFLWWRLVADDYRREQDELFDLNHEDDIEPNPDLGATAQ
ncbi:cytochrome oxidase assembly protein ShyY1 [Arthrobacter silviterrae]|uniref:SURF1-like protein n=1 Tax=Arthrobacter silviterrae TaxID=2026658 RepID=A0ABX0DKW6_9MICC|nr:SURF1 family protein [Arthrobacter silviterrae]MDQ0277539.1 cytochrome oxidase assembly protein ShyY1 [Arthrobacter silviterrae]NGN85340.1 SURF1 family protein [Arthrobacter silviterrae]